eukprot:CAMPEP_0197584608 /NCGR_PEP_ID=MMETSP1326-20131121/7168_1 /TAXON_ID=1155430 /ORGANISM="Genus nov. species nov., Strain RCC2288" /LENGTH=81 /DNA_ID=CAMNT_0043148997 /DNA_START=101 /DNA_END=342 /DNA_ORIENTATION=-
MKVIAAYLLLIVGGNTAPTAADVKTVLAAAGTEADADALTRLTAALEGKTVEELSEIIAAGKEKLVNIGGGAAAPAAAGAA